MKEYLKGHEKDMEKLRFTIKVLTILAIVLTGLIINHVIK